MSMHGWITPTVTREDDGTNVIVDPIPYPGTNATRLTVETNVDGVQRCEESLMETIGGALVELPCPLQRGHVGPHWQCTPELAAEIAPAQIWAHLVNP